MSLMITVKIENMTQVLASLTKEAGNVRGIEISDWDGTRVVSSLVIFQVILSLLFLPSFLIGDLTIPEMQGMYMQGV